MEVEYKLVRGNLLLKALWVLTYPVMYIVRGVVVFKGPSFWELINLVSVIITNVIVYYVLGPKALGYLALSTWFGYSIHPAAAHFIQEHYTWADGQETYSYYGVLNKIFLNVGYHNEHHDFTKVSSTR